MNSNDIKKAPPPRLEEISDTLRIYQQKGVFSYGTDAVLLAAYAAAFMKFSSRRTLFDLCSGTGIIGLTLLDRYRRSGCLSVSAIEINKDACALSEMSAAESGLSDLYTVYNTDIKDTRGTFQADIADFVTVNPPYMTADCGFMCEDNYKTIARHEVLCSLEDVFRAAFHLLKTGGTAFVVYRPERLSTLFAAARAAHLEIKHMTFVHSRAGSESRLVLCAARKNAKEGLKIGKPFVMYGEGEEYSEEYLILRDKGEMKIE